VRILRRNRRQSSGRRLLEGNGSSRVIENRQGVCFVAPDHVGRSSGGIRRVRLIGFARKLTIDVLPAKIVQSTDHQEAEKQKGTI